MAFEGLKLVLSDKWGCRITSGTTVAIVIFSNSNSLVLSFSSKVDQ